MFALSIEFVRSPGPVSRGPQQNGDSYLIQEKDVRRFILEHPTDIDLRKVDQIWFLDYQRIGARSLKAFYFCIGWPARLTHLSRPGRRAAGRGITLGTRLVIPPWSG